MQYSYQIKGMHCQSCIEKIKLGLGTEIHIAEITLNPPLLQIEAAEEPNVDDLNNKLSKIGKYQLEKKNGHSSGLTAYYPLFLIFVYILGVALLNNWSYPILNWRNIMNQFMAGFFLVFSAFKLLDLKGFADGYATYDLLAKKWFFYGYIYPFLELALGLLYLTQAFPLETQTATILIMGFSSLGVMNSLYKKQKFQCACLGTLLKIPLSIVTLIEDLLMVALAGLMLAMM